MNWQSKQKGESMGLRQRDFTGTTSKEVTEREKEAGKLVRKAASEGFVLLKNDSQLLPLPPKSKIALYGAGAGKTIKGGTGSGDVNERESVSIYQGLVQAGYEITTNEWLASYEEEYQKAREAWSRTIQNKMKEENFPFYLAYFNTPFAIPAGKMIEKKSEADDAEVAVYVLSRSSGEGADRTAEQGDYFLTDKELSLLKRIAGLYPAILLVLNTGGIVDLGFTEEIPQIKSILLFGQAGQEGGNAFADVIAGKKVPSGKLTDTWAEKLSDYPVMKFPNPNKCRVEYREGIYVGYRYFDTFQIPVTYSFGFGLSYTEFQINAEEISYDTGQKKMPCLRIKAAVENIGKRYKGKEVVQAYVSCPQNRLEKEFRRLAAFNKTKELNPGETQTSELVIPLSSLASYDEVQSAWILEQGIYGIWLGNALENAKLVGTACLEKETIVCCNGKICENRSPIEELHPDKESQKRREKDWQTEAQKRNLPCINLGEIHFPSEDISYSSCFHQICRQAEQIVSALSQEELIAVTIGALDSQNQGIIGAAGKSVPGAAAETTSILKNAPHYLAGIILADGPAGLRIRQTYQVKDGQVQDNGSIGELEQQFFPHKDDPEGVTYYQYCTAMPVGTLVAQTWNLELAECLGKMVGREMELFEISLWLAPGMNIHRNPLGGRNFEYYSEDPWLTGKIAAAMVRGVQSVPGCGATIKHFACNNQEEERLQYDTVVSERTLREIYLRSFEWAIKEIQPMAVMTAYNRINGIYAANHEELCTEVMRREWKYSGVLMTDWASTVSSGDGSCSATGCMKAGNDLIMPGSDVDFQNIQNALDNGTMSIQNVKDCAYRIIRMILQTNQYEDAPVYNHQFSD